MSERVSLWEMFAQVPDPRGRRGRRYELQAMLTLVGVAMLSGARSVLAIAQFGRDYGRKCAKLLGFERGKTPCCTTLHYLFCSLDAEAFEEVVERWLGQCWGAGGKTLALDGKTLRGTQGSELPGVHLLAAYAQEMGSAVAQLRVARDRNEHKAALQLLNVLPLRDAIVTGDAAFCQKDLSREVLRKGGHYVWAVKDNQCGLKEDIETALSDESFSPRENRLAAAERQHAEQSDKGHGRSEHRRIVTTTVLKGYTDWPGLEQAFRLERRRTVQGRTTTEVAYGITSLPREQADAERLLQLARAHWKVENCLFHTLDVTFGEDHCRVRSGSAPVILASLRNLAVHLLARSGSRNKAAALRRHAAQPRLALALVRGTS